MIKQLLINFIKKLNFIINSDGEDKDELAACMKAKSLLVDTVQEMHLNEKGDKSECEECELKDICIELTKHTIDE